MMYLKFRHHINIEKRRVTTYGIIAVSLKTVKVFKDVSTDNAAVKQLVKRLNNVKVETVHIPSILEDFYLTKP